MPPLQALVALHGLWVLIFLALAIWAARTWQPRYLRLAGYALCAAGLTALAIVFGRVLQASYSAIGPAQEKYVLQRVLYSLLTNTDLPVVQVILAGIALWFSARRRQRSAVLARTQPPPGKKPS